MRVSLLQLGQ